MNNKEWTIMIYMAGDNNLSVDMAYALEQIKGVAGDGPDSPNLFVYYDGNSPSIPTLYCDFSDPKRPKYVRSFMVPEKLYDVPAKQNENAANRKSMLNFVNWCMNDVEVIGPNGEISYGRRANRYAFIISGHSLGFQDIGLFKDESTGKTMKMNDLYFTLAQVVATQKQLDDHVKECGLEGDDARRERTLLVGQPFDILGFDACVMGMLEVGYQFSSIAKTMIASEGSVPSAGWTYAKILGNLASGRDGDSNAVAERFVRDFIRSQDAFTVGGSSVDMAAWDLSKLDEVTNAFDELSIILLACFDDKKSRIYRQMERAILHVHWKCQSYMFDQNVDLGDFCELLDKECSYLIDELGGGEDTMILVDLQQACRKVLKELDKAVILSGFSGGEYQYSNGISVFFPWSRDGYEVSKKNYEGLFFVKDSGRARQFTWTGFLKKYLQEVALREFEPPEDVVSTSAKYRYYSGVKFDEYSLKNVRAEDEAGSFENDTRMAGQTNSKMAGQTASKMAGQADSKMAGQADSKMAGQADSKMAGQTASKMAGQADSKMAGQTASKMAGQADSKMAGQTASKMAGQADSKMAGQADSKMAGQTASKMAGQADSKMAGQTASKMAGQADSKMAGQSASKMAGQADSKMAGQTASKMAGQANSKLGGGGGGSDRFFDTLKMFKNIESRWDVSGFTKKPAESEADAENADATHG